MFGPHWDDNQGYQNTMGGYGMYGGLGSSFNSKYSGRGGQG